MSETNEEIGEDQKVCEVCSTVPDSFIYLSCGHSICLLCAAKVVFSDNQAVGSCLKKSNMHELECLFCGEKTLISEEIKAAFIELIENGEISLEDEATGTQPDPRSVEEAGEVGSPTQVAETTEGEEEYMEAFNEQGANEGGEEEEDAEEQGEAQKEPVAAETLSFLQQIQCPEHGDEYCTHYSAESKRLLCPQCILQLKYRQKQLDCRPIRKCSK